MGLAGAAGGASNVIKQILAERALAQQQQIENSRAQQMQARADEQLGLQRGEFEATQATQRNAAQRQQQNDAALDAMAADQTLPEPVRRIVALKRRGVNVDIGDLTPKPVTPPTRRLVSIKGPKGEKIEKALTDEELAQGVQGYEAPDKSAQQHAFRMAEIGAQNQARQTTEAKPKPATEGERKNAGFYHQMDQAIQNLQTLESTLTDRDIYQIQSLPQEGFTGAINRGHMSDNAKRYIQAFNQFTEARLRPVSGAAISDAEYARDRATYGKQYGETPDLSKQRGEARTRALDSLRGMAGVAVAGPMTATVDPQHLGNVPPQGGAGGGQYQAGQTVTLRDGRSVTIKKINPDGTFEY